MKTLALVVLLIAGASFGAEPGPTVAILYFDYDGKDDELVTLRKGLAQMLITDLAGRENYRVVERAKLQEALAELDLVKTQKLDPTAQLKVGRLLQARYLVVGGYLVMGGALRLDARVFDVETSALVKGIGATGKAEDFFALEQKVAQDVDAVLLSVAAKKASAPAAKPAPSALAKSAKGVVPLKAVQQLSKALQAKDDKDFEKAKQQLDVVVKQNPDFLLARLELGEIAQ